MRRRALKVLAIDTSTLTGSVALISGGVVLAESVARVRATHSESLLPMVDEVLRRAGTPLGEVDLLAVDIGPGSFTGIRIGMATAKGLRLASGTPLVGVTSLEALAAGAIAARGALLTALDAHRGEVYAAAYRVDASGRRELMPPSAGIPEAMGAAARAAAGPGEILALGDLSEAYWSRLGAGAGGDLVVLPAVAGTPLARFVALEALRGGHPTDEADALEAVYVRPSDAKLPGG